MVLAGEPPAKIFAVGFLLLSFWRIDKRDLLRIAHTPSEQGTMRGEAGLPKRATQLGAPGPGLERTGRHCMQSPGKQRRGETNGAQAACKLEGLGGGASK